MLPVQLPTEPAAAIDCLRSLRIEFSDAITDVQFAALASSFGKSSPSSRRKSKHYEEHHAEIRAPASVGSRSGELYGLLGVHGGTRPSKPPTRGTSHEAGEFWYHAELLLRPHTSKRPDVDSGWDVVSQALYEIVGPQSAHVSLQLEVPASDAILAVSLPIPVKASAVAGFSEIRGVNLVRVDESNPTIPLYSVILQHFGKRVTATAMTDVETTFDRDVLIRAWDRALSIAQLAIKSLSV